jgi:hypothetical protein
MRQRFQQTLRRLATEGDIVHVAFSPKPTTVPNQRPPKDNEFWPGEVVATDIEGVEHDGNLVIIITQPQPVEGEDVFTEKVFDTHESWEAAMENFGRGYLKLDANVSTAKSQVSAASALQFEEEVRQKLQHVDTLGQDPTIRYGALEDVQVDDNMDVDDGNAIIYGDDGAILNDHDYAPMDDDEPTLPSTPRDVLIEKIVLGTVLIRQFLQGNGLPILLEYTFGLPVRCFFDPELTPEDILDMIHGRKEQPADDKIIPRINFLATSNQDLTEILLSRIRPDTRVRLRQYLKKVWMGILVITGFAGSGKTDVLATVINIVLTNRNLNKVMACAPSNAATQNLAERVAHLNRIAVLAYNRGHLTSTIQPALVVRGHPVSIEVEAIISTIRPTPGGNSSKRGRFQMPLSVCEWTLKVMGVAKHDLYRRDPQVIYNLAEDFQEMACYDGLRRFTRGEISWDDLVAEHEEKYLGQQPELAPGRLVRSIMKRVVMNADALFTTPHASRDDMYWEYNRDVAKFSVGDEAGGQFPTATLQSWPWYRPAAFAGDHKQLKPTVMSKFLVDQNGNKENMFSEHGEVSTLLRARATGFPAYIMHEQLRVVVGGFDLARSLFYSDIRDFVYLDLSRTQNHAKAVRVEEMTTGMFPEIRSALRQGRVLPAFIQCTGVCEVEDSTGSRYNSGKRPQFWSLYRPSSSVVLW